MKISARKQFEGLISALMPGPVNAAVTLGLAGGDSLVAVVTAGSMCLRGGFRDRADWLVRCSLAAQLSTECVDNAVNNPGLPRRRPRRCCLSSGLPNRRAAGVKKTGGARPGAATYSPRSR